MAGLATAKAATQHLLINRLIYKAIRVLLSDACG